jgi:carbon storage regulator
MSYNSGTGLIKYNVTLSREDHKMLVLLRKRGEVIRVNDNIIIKVVNCGGGSVSLGIEAPREIQVHREEVYERILEERRKQFIK